MALQAQYFLIPRYPGQLFKVSQGKNRRNRRGSDSLQLDLRSSIEKTRTPAAVRKSQKAKRLKSGIRLLGNTSS